MKKLLVVLAALTLMSGCGEEAAAPVMLEHEGGLGAPQRLEIESGVLGSINQDEDGRYYVYFQQSDLGEFANVRVYLNFVRGDSIGNHLSVFQRRGTVRISGTPYYEPTLIVTDLESW